MEIAATVDGKMACHRNGAAIAWTDRYTVHVKIAHLGHLEVSVFTIFMNGTPTLCYSL